MASEISNIMDSFTPKEDETQCVGLSQTIVDASLEECKNRVFVVIYSGGVINAYGFRIAMSMSWKCEYESFKMHILKDDVFLLIFHTSKTRDYVLSEGPWNFSNKLLIIHPWDPITRSPLSVFNSAHFNFCIIGLLS